MSVVEAVEKEGVVYNRIAQLFPLQAVLGRAPNPQIPAESQGIFDEEPPW